MLGGGPAGAALAARLAALGRDVLVVERSVFPREHVGESLSPGVWDVLRALGVEPPARRAPARSVIRWGGREEVRRGGFTVDRGRFDAVLLRCARERGARVLQPALAGRPQRVDGGWRVPVRARDETVVVEARVVADASGRARALGGAREWTGPPTTALHARWDSFGGRTETRVESLGADGWLWGASLPGGGFRAMAFAPRDAVRARGAERVYADLLGRSELFAPLLAAGRRDGPLRACDATCFTTPDPIDAASIRLGEAGFAIDPLSSSGVQTALQSGLAAAAAVHTLLDPEAEDEPALEFFRDHQRHAVERHAALAAEAHAEARGASTAPEAEAEADAEALRPPAAPAPLADPEARGAPAIATLAATRVRLAEGAALVPTACLVGDRVERRRALTHPSLRRPVAFLGGRELAPIVDALTASPSLGAAVQRGAAPPAVAEWLAARGVLEPDP